MGAVIEMKRQESEATGCADLVATSCRVLSVGGECAVVLTASGPRECRLAASCLLRPEADDLVLAALPKSAADAAYVLAVLERREPGGPARLDLPGSPVLAARKGGLRIEAAGGIALETPGELSATAGNMRFAAGCVRWLARTWSLVGDALEFIAARVRETAAERDTQAKTWTQRLGDSFRHVEELDETQAGMVRTLARDTALLHGRVAYVQAEEFVKVDGEEVHLG